MDDSMVAYLRWVDEDQETFAGPRTARVAWLVCDGAAEESPAPADEAEPGTETGTDTLTESRAEPRYLAYLGQRPAITPQLIEEVSALYPEVIFDWDALRRDVAREPGRTNVVQLTDDELAQSLRTLSAEHELSLNDLSLRLGYRQRNILPDLLRFLDDPATVARFERTAGSIFEYLVSRHPEYAFLLYKARLLFAGDEEALRQVMGAEPAGFGQKAWRERRAFWRAQLDAYRASKQI